MSVTDGMLTIEVPKAALAIFTMIAVVGMLMILPRCLSLFQTLNAGLVRTAEKAGFRFDPVLTGLASLTWFVVFATLLTGLFTAIVLLVFRPVPTPETVWSWRFSLAQIAGLTAVLGAIIALPFTIMRLLLNRKQTETAEQGMITDRINKAVAGLGEEKIQSRLMQQVSYTSTGTAMVEVLGRGDEPSNYVDPDSAKYGDWQVVQRTVPNLEVRIGAIYALERIAQDSARDHVQIMEILCAYIRENAPAREAPTWPELEMLESEQDEPLEKGWEARLADFRTRQKAMIDGVICRTDILAALSVIGRRTAHQRQLEAAWGTENETAPFTFDNDYPDAKTMLPDDDHDPKALAQFEAEKDTWDAEAHGYKGYRLDLRDTNLRGADLSDLNFTGAKFQGAQMQAANLEAAQMQGAILCDAHMQGADLNEARISSDTDLTAVIFQGAAVRFVDFTNLAKISPHFADLFGDGSVTLPKGMGKTDWPAHWPQIGLVGQVEVDGKQVPRFHHEWRKWQKDPEGYKPPEK